MADPFPLKKIIKIWEMSVLKCRVSPISNLKKKLDDATYFAF